MNDRIFPLRLLKNSKIRLFDSFEKYQKDKANINYPLSDYENYKEIYFKDGDFTTLKNNFEEVDPKRGLAGIINENVMIKIGGLFKFIEENSISFEELNHYKDELNKTFGSDYLKSKNRVYHNEFTYDAVHELMDNLFKDKDYLITMKNGIYRIEGKIILKK
jgi:hypothetical protein